jgi:hypothetical protein
MTSRKSLNAMSMIAHEARKIVESEAAGLAAQGRAGSYRDALRLFAVGAIEELVALGAVDELDRVASFARDKAEDLDPAA